MLRLSSLNSVGLGRDSGRLRIDQFALRVFLDIACFRWTDGGPEDAEIVDYQ
jgi:hypothetical protein